ncbi:uncharacterized protein SPAPADRAFT_61524 [Spathaspora passalidarum NRRL Y-27907]|uniref:Uncharacterized protein n=1 Tax=Spathaspora passalidarum (strain NRRL Y-27907 / 11-Y1) TaxID=619300 RepID=G3AN42_SPAPN|nr:uncharacterized protein SPAPADRAFT_61524 [Spathaspora passalidarum NRRL Y-27907]EGW32456.1 hypothetical protein SPAPADRAFT_61524 [Spathaspora passalidarum NRRL Y-27907]
METAIPTIPALPSTSTFLNRWQKGKNFWSSVCEGRVSIEPVKGTNESFKLAYRGSMSHVTPVAIRDSCSFCGESRNDNLEHARMHYFKILEPIGDDVIASYPLCNYCLIKLRNVCDLFAKLRVIKSNVFKLKPNSAFDDIATTTNTFGQFKRSTSGSIPKNGDESPVTTLSSTETLMNSQVQQIELDKVEESKLIKLYMMVLLVRLKIFWSKIGFWDNVDRISEINLDEIHYETFEYLIPKSESRASTADKNEGEQEEEQGAKVASETAKGETEDVDAGAHDDSRSDAEEFIDTQDKFEQSTVDEHAEQAPPANNENSHEQETKPEEESEPVESSESQDTQETQQERDEGEPGATEMYRSNSKKFRAKMDSDLDHTLEMLAENIEVNTVE